MIIFPDELFALHVDQIEVFVLFVIAETIVSVQFGTMALVTPKERSFLFGHILGDPAAVTTITGHTTIADQKRTTISSSFLAFTSTPYRKMQHHIFPYPVSPFLLSLYVHFTIYYQKCHHLCLTALLQFCEMKHSMEGLFADKNNFGKYDFLLICVVLDIGIDPSYFCAVSIVKYLVTDCAYKLRYICQFL